MERNEKVTEFILQISNNNNEEIIEDILEIIEENTKMNSRLQISPQGDDRIDELEDIISKMAGRIEQFEERYFEN